MVISIYMHNWVEIPDYRHRKIELRNFTVAVLRKIGYGLCQYMIWSIGRKESKRYRFGTKLKNWSSVFNT